MQKPPCSRVPAPRLRTLPVVGRAAFGAHAPPPSSFPRRFGSALGQPAGARKLSPVPGFLPTGQGAAGLAFEACRAGSRSASSPPPCPGGNASPGREVPGSAWAGGGRMETQAEDAGLSCRPMLASSWDAACGALAHSLVSPGLTSAPGTWTGRNRWRLLPRGAAGWRGLGPRLRDCRAPGGAGRAGGGRAGRGCGPGSRAGDRSVRGAGTGVGGGRAPGAGGRGRGRECRARGWRHLRGPAPPGTRTSAGSEPGSASLSPHKRTSEGLLSPESALINVTVQSPQQLRYGKDRRLPLSVLFRTLVHAVGAQGTFSVEMRSDYRGSRPHSRKQERAEPRCPECAFPWQSVLSACWVLGKVRGPQGQMKK